MTEQTSEPIRAASRRAHLTMPSRRLRVTPRAAWLGARARNVLQRRLRLGVIALLACLAVLAAYVLLPSGARGLSLLLARGRAAPTDTTSLLAREAAARLRLFQTTAQLDDARARRAASVASLATPTLTSDAVARRDSLSRIAGALGALIQRAENAPLPESYRALGESPVLRADARVRALTDSLVEITRERDELGGGATVDPVFVSLTSQANSLGRAIQSIAEAQLTVLKSDIAVLQTPQPVLPDSATLAAMPDTVAAATARANAARELANARATLAAGRAANATAAAVEARERSRAQLAPLPILVGGAISISIALAFAFVLVDEMRSPRVADAQEAERLTALRVLTVTRIRAIPPDRVRRAADRSVPPLIDPSFDANRVLSWHLTAQWPSDGIITVTGDDPMVAATVAANLAAVLATDARITLLIDADFEAQPVQRVLGLPNSPGLAAVLENRRKWSESLLSVTVGRGRTVDVLPSGSRDRFPGPAESAALVGEIRKAARRHDATIVVTSMTGARRLRGGDNVIVCATRTKTRLATLGRYVATLIDEGAWVRGVVLWEGALPSAAQKRRDGGDASPSQAA